MNLPNKIKIIKAHDGLPPVGTVMEYSEDISTYKYNWSAVDRSLISLALEAGYAEEVKEQWQAWERGTTSSYFFIGNNLNIGETTNRYSSYGLSDYLLGNYFPTRELAEQARDRILETLKQFHKEHKNDNTTKN